MQFCKMSYTFKSLKGLCNVTASLSPSKGILITEVRELKWRETFWFDGHCTHKPVACLLVCGHSLDRSVHRPATGSRLRTASSTSVDTTIKAPSIDCRTCDGFLGATSAASVESPPFDDCRRRVVMHKVPFNNQIKIRKPALRKPTALKSVEDSVC